MQFHIASYVLVFFLTVKYDDDDEDVDSDG